MDHSEYNNNNSSNFNDDWEDKEGDFLWTEKEWQTQLTKSAEAINHFMLLYKHLKHSSAPQLPILNDELTWDNDYFNQIQRAADGSFLDLDSEKDDEEVLFTQPPFIALRGIFLYICDTWETFIRNYEQPLSGTIVSILLNVAKETEIQALFMFQAFEAGEFSLVNICSKRALFLLNRLFDCLNALRIHPQKAASLDNVCQAISTACFDAREVILKVKTFCSKAVQDIE